MYLLFPVPSILPRFTNVWLLLSTSIFFNRIYTIAYYLSHLQETEMPAIKHDQGGAEMSGGRSRPSSGIPQTRPLSRAAAPQKAAGPGTKPASPRNPQPTRRHAPKQDTSTLPAPRGSRTEPPVRPSSLRPAEPVISSSHPPAEEFNNLYVKVCREVHLTSLGRMFEDVCRADRQGNIDEEEYRHLLDFFYCFVPMLVVAPKDDPIIVRPYELRNHWRLLRTRWADRGSGSGPNNPHRWFSRPRNSFSRTVKEIM